jgi:hypothetical protein
MKRFAYYLYTFACALAIALTLLSVAHGAPCRWDRPGADPFMGDVPAAVDRYADIPADVRATLRDRMQRHQYDDIVDIRRDSIAGAHRYDATIRDMHFGQGRVCASITRQRWLDDTHERGLVYCESGHCVMVPTVCRNVSRITRLRPAVTDSADRLSFEQLTAALPAIGYVPAPADYAESSERNVVMLSDYLHVFRTDPVPFVFDVPAVPVTPVPEPETWALMLAGLLVLLARRGVRP